MQEPRSEPRKRGVRLTDLDRSQVYRIGFVGRRWEVLGAEGAPVAGAGPDEWAGRGGRPEAEPRAGYSPRHAGPAAPH